VKDPAVPDCQKRQEDEDQQRDQVPASAGVMAPAFQAHLGAAEQHPEIGSQAFRAEAQGQQDVADQRLPGGVRLPEDLAEAVQQKHGRDAAGHIAERDIRRFLVLGILQMMEHIEKKQDADQIHFDIQYFKSCSH